RKRIGTGLLEAFSQTCEHCNGRGLVLLDSPVEPRRSEESSGRGGRRRGRGRGEGGNGNGAAVKAKPVPSPRDIAVLAREHAEKQTTDEASSATAPQTGSAGSQVRPNQAAEQEHVGQPTAQPQTTLTDPGSLAD